jgi:hypothetical protein
VIAGVILRWTSKRFSALNFIDEKKPHADYVALIVDGKTKKNDRKSHKNGNIELRSFDVRILEQKFLNTLFLKLTTYLPQYTIFSCYLSLLKFES